MGSDEVKFGRNEYSFLAGTEFYAIDYRGERWPTVRQAYEAEKFERVDIREAIRWARSVDDAKEVSAKHKRHRREGWDAATKIATMALLMHELIRQHARLRERLLATGNRELVFRSHSYFWGVDKDGNGMNEHGKLVMRIREHERQFENSQAAE